MYDKYNKNGTGRILDKSAEDEWKAGSGKRELREWKFGGHLGPCEPLPSSLVG